MTETMARSPIVTPSLGASTTQQIKVMIDNKIITGTNMLATLSTVCWIRALLPCASRTIRIIEASIVSLPTFSARISKVPFWFIVPANTLSPAAFLFATGSPVSMDSSMKDSPEITTPSAGILSPGLTL